MDVVASQDQQSLQAQLEQARERLDELVRDLRVVDDEFEGLAEEREQYGLLSQACAALEALRDRGAGALFWGERVGDHEADGQVRLARGRVNSFEKRLTEIEERRQEVLEAIQRQEENTEIIEDYLFEARRREEERKLQWIIEREMSELPARATVMPWTREGEEDERFRRSLAIALLISIVLGLLLPLVDLPIPERWEPIEVPERFARLIREERPVPPPPPVQPQTKPEELQPKTEESPVVAETPKPQPTPGKNVGNKGILAFREKFSGLAMNTAPSRLGSQARITGTGGAASGYATRNMVATLASGSSGGINLASLSRDVGGGGGEGIEGIQVTRATSSIGGGGGGTDRPLSDGPGPSRTDEEIQIVFDRHKAALYRLYNRELRRDPTLQGQMTLRIRIEPDGSVSLCALQGTDMDAPELAAQVVARVKTFDFGAKEGIAPVTILYPIDFLPAT